MGAVPNGQVFAALNAPYYYFNSQYIYPQIPLDSPEGVKVWINPVIATALVHEEDRVAGVDNVSDVYQ